jgi:hypothetical protein
MSDKIIEQMARAICCRGRNCQTKDGRCVMDPVHYAFATAAYNALREMLVPVGWVYAQEGEQSLTSPWRVKAEGWTETPLFALPEIEP